MSKILHISMQYYAEAVPDPKPDDTADNNAPGGDSGTDGQPAGETNTDGLPQTQEELDKLIERRIAKEQKKWAKTQQPGAQGDASGQAGSSDPLPDNSAELAALRAELLEAKAQSAAAVLGCRPDCIEDAVYLAIRNASKDGEPDDEDIKAALTALLKKHPDWKNDATKQFGGFKVGVGSSDKNHSSTDDLLRGIFRIKKK